MVAFASRLLLLWLSGWLMSSGWINDELQQTLLTDPAITDALQALLSLIFAGAWGVWWKYAKSRGWKT